MTKYLVTSFYTVDTPYEEEAKKRLIPSLLKHGIPHYVVGVKSHGDWRRNIYEKAETILNAFNRVPAGRAVVWLDAEALERRWRVHSHPGTNPLGHFGPAHRLLEVGVRHD